jgi:hypothetical protein
MAMLLVPGIGGLLLLIALPLISQGFMIGTQQALTDRTPMPEAFVLPLRVSRSRTVELLKIGLIYAACSFVIMWISSVVDGGRFETLLDAMPASEIAAVGLRAFLLVSLDRSAEGNSAAPSPLPESQTPSLAG